MKPIRPEEVVEAKRVIIPDKVIEVFNDFIAERWSGRSSYFKQKDVVAEILRRMNEDSPDLEYREEELFRKHWLDVEDIYRQAGWIVEYDKPGYCENYDATFKFSKEDKRNKPMNGAYI